MLSPVAGQPDATSAFSPPPPPFPAPPVAGASSVRSHPAAPHRQGVARGGGLIVTLRVPAACSAADLPLGPSRAAPPPLTRNGAAWQRPLAGVAYERVSIPGPAGPIRATVAVAARRGPRAAAARALDHRRARRDLGPGAVAPGLRARRAGARVLMPDPRGSASYGRAWLEAIRGAWGGADADDQLACVDWAVRQGARRSRSPRCHRPLLRRLHDDWLIGQTDRFRAAVSGERRRATRSPPSPTATRARCGRRGWAGASRPPTSSASGSSRRSRTPIASRRRC